MTLLVRSIAALTVVLGFSLMAVSAYAAKTEPDGGPVFSPWQGFGALGTDDVDEGTGTSGVATPTATPAPTVVLQYAAPLGAAPVSSVGSGRGNLSDRPQVWPVESLKPRPVNLLNLTQGGLNIPPDQLAVMQQVSVATSIPWQIFAAIAKVESNFGLNMGPSSAGAIGYGQFLPAMWEIFGDGGDAYDFRDALPAMGRYLVAAGAPADMPGALYSYNHSWSYVDLVLSYAESYGYRREVSSQGLIWPVVGPISTYFEPGHPAIDIDQTAQPGAPVRAAHDGVVLSAGGDPCCGYGYYVTLVGPSGIVTLYAHFQDMFVNAGQTVRQGDVLGGAGCTGRCTGTHVHFEVTVDRVRQDPLLYLP